MTDFENMQPDRGDDMQRQQPATAYTPTPQRPTSGLAIASMVLGISALLSCGLTSIPGVIVGIMAMNQIKDPAKNMQGKGMALTGIITSCIAIAFGLLMLAIWIVLLVQAS